MAYSLSQLWSQKDAEQSFQGWGATEYFSIVGTPAELADTKNLLLTPGLPRLGQSHPANRDLRCATLQAGPGLAERVVSARYQWLPNGFPTGGGNENLLAQSPTISWSRATREESLGADVYGNLITNSAGDPVDPPPTKTAYSRILEITRYEREYKPEVADRFENTTNAKEIIAGGRRFPAATVLCQSIYPAQEYTADATAILIRYTFEVRTRFWSDGTKPTKIDEFPFRFWHADLGLRCFFGATAATQRLGDVYGKIRGTTGTTDSLGERVDTPIRLGGNGVPADFNDYYVTDQSRAPTTKNIFPAKDGPLKVEIKTALGRTVFIGWRIYPGEDFLFLGL